MKLLKIAGLAVAWLLVAIIAVGCVFLFRTNAQVRATIAATQASAAELPALSSTHAKLAAAAPAEAQNVRREQDECARLRAEIDALRVQLAALRRRVPRPESTARDVANARARAARVPVPPGMLTPDQLQIRGNATPADAWETWQWAMHNDAIGAKMALVEFTPAAHDGLQAIFDALPEDERAAYGTPERMGIAVTASGDQFMPVAERMFPRVQLVSQIPTGPDEITLMTRVQEWNEVYDAPALNLKHYADGWKVALGPEAVAVVRTKLPTLPPAQRLAMLKWGAGDTLTP